MDRESGHHLRNQTIVKFSCQFFAWSKLEVASYSEARRVQEGASLFCLTSDGKRTQPASGSFAFRGLGRTCVCAGGDALGKRAGRR